MGNETDLRYEETPIIDEHSGVAPIPSSDESIETPEGLRSITPEAQKVFEETPEMIPQDRSSFNSDHNAPSQPPPSHQKKRIHAGTMLFIVILFGLGVWLAGQFRLFFAPVTDQGGTAPVSGAIVPSSKSTVFPSVSPSKAVEDVWQRYEVVSGSTKKPIPGLSYQLPRIVKAPVCDSISCASSGTNLPGGTRFTVAVRGKGQLLPDFRGAILTDATGKEFTMKQTIVAGISLYEYVGEFIGRTGGGYAFTQMRGVLIPVSETLAVELNHFAPTGSTTDFKGDDTIFEKIIGSFTATGYALPSPTVQPTLSLPTVTPATMSGF